jgi:hypothetical protein
VTPDSLPLRVIVLSAAMGASLNKVNSIIIKRYVIYTTKSGLYGAFEKIILLLHVSVIYTARTGGEGGSIRSLKVSRLDRARKRNYSLTLIKYKQCC